MTQFVDIESCTRKLATKDAEITRLTAENTQLREALDGVVAAHDSYLASLPTVEGWQVSDPLADACEAARAALEATR